MQVAESQDLELEIPEGFLVLSDMCAALGLRKPPVSTDQIWPREDRVQACYWPPRYGFPGADHLGGGRVAIRKDYNPAATERFVQMAQRFLRSSSHRNNRVVTESLKAEPRQRSNYPSDLS